MYSNQAGMFCGPSGLSLVYQDGIEQVQTLASLGSIFMLFAMGVNFPLKQVVVRTSTTSCSVCPVDDICMDNN